MNLAASPPLVVQGETENILRALARGGGIRASALRFAHLPN